MWSPADKTALPSNEDRIQANIAIQCVKSEIEETEVLLAQTQLKLDVLRKELAEREAWLAPVRKLSHDELTIVFNMCAEVDWFAPMHLSAVCRVWRSAILANSRAWSYIYLVHSRAHKLFPLYVERSRQGMLRAVLDGSARPEYYSQMADKIQCLSIPALTKWLYGITFPFLSRLCLITELRPMALLRLSRVRFPALRRLEAYFPEKASQHFTDETIDLPLLQTLRLNSNGGVNFMPIVHKYSQFLTSLDFSISPGTSLLQQSMIALPKLENLMYNDFGKEKFPITMTTPMLKVFTTTTNYDSSLFPLEMDLGLLTHVRTDGKQIPPLSELSGLKALQVRLDSHCYSEILKPLVDDPSVCRELGTVELRLRKLSDADRSYFRTLFLQINRPRTSHIEHFIQGRFTPWHTKLPQVGYYICEGHMH